MNTVSNILTITKKLSIRLAFIFINDLNLEILFALCKKNVPNGFGEKSHPERNFLQTQKF